MKNRVVHIIIFCLLGIASPLMAQSVPWQFTPTASNHTIFLQTSANPNVDGVPLQAGDAVGVFYDSLGTLACAGYTVWNNTNTFIAAYGEANGFSGFADGEEFKFKIWKQADDCVIDSVDATFLQGAPATHTNQFASDGISALTSLSGMAQQLSFLDTRENCTELVLFAPQYTNAAYNWSDGSTADTLVVTESGEYFLELIPQGGCPIYDTIEVTYTPFSIDNLFDEVENAKCNEDGKVILPMSFIEAGLPPYRYLFTDLLNNNVFEFSQDTALLPTGEYELIVEDSRGCQLVYPDDIIVELADDCEEIFNPNDPFHNTFYIPYTGTARIYDRQGRLQKQMPIPAKWDGTDGAGKPLGMGQYIIVCENGEQIQVTLIR